ncbi:sigma-70 family RNA polymerase sigma factor [Paenibacillus filicis]|uniref:Sigma-70 family RNA polymerase sigma factor n=1 Tax=Paenibacillus filicis TaxID=669464 RepID=A0ABU9DFD7_9BACL
MEVSEQELVRRLLARDPAALEAVIDRYGSCVHELASRVLAGIASQEDVEECVSDAFVAAWHKIEAFDPGRGSLKTWLYILAKYTALDYRRKLGARPGQEKLESELRSAEDVEEAVLQRLESEDILRLLDTLDRVDRVIFFRKYMFYESLEVIAQSLGLTRKAVENRLRRGRMALRQRMSPEMKEGWS